MMTGSYIQSHPNLSQGELSARELVGGTPVGSRGGGPEGELNGQLQY